jgi:hypothetical protein
MSLEGLSGLVNRIIAWADRLQRELGFPYAVVKKYGDEGGRQAALITYYGFLSISRCCCSGWRPCPGCGA